MMADEIVRKFRALRNSDERLDSLQKLVQITTVEERQYLSALISQRNDPLLVLPVEIVVQVFRHLPLSCTWRLQCVSEQWLRVLSSDDLFRPAVMRWQSHDPSDAAECLELSSKVSTESIVHRMKAHHTRHHVAERIFDEATTEQPMSQIELVSGRAFCLKGQRIAYISTQRGDSVVVHDLANGEERVLRGDAREKILAVVLTSNLAAFVTFDGHLYVSKHSKPANDRARHRIPSSAVRAMSGHDEVIVLAFGQSQRPGAWVTQLLLYDSRTGKLQSFGVDTAFNNLSVTGEELASCSLLVDSKRRVIDIFHLLLRVRPKANRGAEKSLLVNHMRMMFDGTWLSANAWQTEILDDNVVTIVRLGQYILSPPCPTGNLDEYRIMIYDGPFRATQQYHLRFATLFDSKSGNFHAEQDRELGSKTKDHDDRQMNALWKGQYHRPTLLSAWEDAMVNMNETFTVSLERPSHIGANYRIRVLCFDPGVWSHKKDDEKACREKLIVNPKGAWDRFMTDFHSNRLVLPR